MEGRDPACADFPFLLLPVQEEVGVSCYDSTVTPFSGPPHPKGKYMEGEQGLEDSHCSPISLMKITWGM